MEKEVTVLEQFSMICDVLYKIIWIGLIVLNAFYVVGNLAVGWIIIAALGCCILKTIVGLFNYCLIVDIIHYYCDLSIGLIAGWCIGNWFNFYKVGFYEFSLVSYILPIVCILVFSVLKYIIPNKRSYRNLFLLAFNFYLRLNYHNIVIRLKKYSNFMV